MRGTLRKHCHVTILGQCVCVYVCAMPCHVSALSAVFVAYRALYDPEARDAGSVVTHGMHMTRGWLQVIYYKELKIKRDWQPRAKAFVVQDQACADALIADEWHISEHADVPMVVTRARTPRPIYIP